MDKTKPYDISKTVVWQAYKRVKANKGAAGIDDESIADFEKNLKDNLYKVWNRMSSGSYFPPAVKAVEIPKKSGGIRVLGIPTVADRVAQMTVKTYFEPLVEPYFHNDSYGYRPNKSAIDAVGITRQRCWRYNWVLEFDIKGLFDNIDHELLMRAVRKHTDCKWIILYIERWLKAPFQTKDGNLIERIAGTPQGGVISPVLANLFLHYTFDKWMERNYPNNPWARYADDAVIHCATKEAAEKLLKVLTTRFLECKLQLHPDKTGIVYCKDSNRRGTHDEIRFDFLGYTFRPRLAKNSSGEYFVSFIPAVSNKAMKAMKSKIRNMKACIKPDMELKDLANIFNPVVRGWINYYGRFYKFGLYPIMLYLESSIMRWASCKYKTLRMYSKKTYNWLQGISRREPKLFSHWQMGFLPTV